MSTLVMMTIRCIHIYIYSYMYTPSCNQTYMWVLFQSTRLRFPSQVCWTRHVISTGPWLQVRKLLVITRGSMVGKGLKFIFQDSPHGYHGFHGYHCCHVHQDSKLRRNGALSGLQNHRLKATASRPTFLPGETTTVPEVVWVFLWESHLWSIRNARRVIIEAE